MVTSFSTMRSSSRLANSPADTSVGDTPLRDMSCFFCGAQHQHVSSPWRWKKEAATRYLQEKGIAKDSVVCQACRKDITKVLSDTTFKPRWCKVHASKKGCVISGCGNDSFASLHKPTMESIQQALATLGLESSHSTVPMPLCKEHYHAVYNAIYPTQFYCVTCAMSLRYSCPRHCPQPATIEGYLKENNGFTGSIGVTDMVCTSCYRSHLFILKKCKPVSTDQDLKNLIQAIEQKTYKNTSTSEVIDECMQQTAAAVGRELLNGNAMLLPDVQDWFRAFAQQRLDLEEKAKVTSGFILSNLIATLQHHMAYSCKTRKFGTLIYRPNADIVQNLARALWKVRQQGKDRDNHTSDTMATTDSNCSTATDSTSPLSSSEVELMNNLNLLARSHIKSFLERYKKDQYELADLIKFKRLTRSCGRQCAY